MNLSFFILTFTMTMNFCPLDGAQLLSTFNRTATGSSDRINHASTSSHHRSSSSKMRSKRSADGAMAAELPRPSKWEAIFNWLMPNSKAILPTRFFLYTRQNPAYGQELYIDDFESLRRSNFDTDKRTIFLINGWQDNRFFAKWVREGVRLLLTRADQNVVYVSWRSIKELFVAAVLIRSYAHYLARFIDFLKNKFSISGESIHCIGHSLGGFMCSFAGNHTYIGRVTVLDAGPRQYYQPKPPTERINRHQAGFMDVIHSDFNPTFSLGLTIPYGDVDFFPNAGTIQPGCWRDKWLKSWEELDDEGPLGSLLQLPRYLLFCSHYRSHEWFFESVANEQCQFVGVLCPNYQMFINGECGCEDTWIEGHGESTCALMGYDAEYAVLRQHLTKYSPQGRWFLKTSDFLEQTGRHCQYQYQLVVQLGQFVSHHQNGSIVVTITATDAQITPNRIQILSHEKLVSRTDGGMLKSGHRLTKLMLRPTSLPLDKIIAVYVSFVHRDQTAMVAIPWVKLAPIHVVQKTPLFFCHVEHFLRPDISRRYHRCTSI